MASRQNFKPENPLMKNKIAWTALILLIYVFLLVYLHDFFDIFPSLLAALPVLLLGWVWGLAGGIVWAFVVGILAVLVDFLFPPFGISALFSFQWFLRVSILAANGGLAGFVRQSQDKTRLLQERFRVLASESPNMVFVNYRGRIVYANPKCTEVMGYTPEEFYSPSFDFLSLIAPEDRDKARANFKRHLLGKEVAPVDYQLVTKEGRRLFARHNTKLVDYDNGKAILGVITDLTEIRNREKKTEELEERYRILTEQTGQLVYDYDVKTGKIIWLGAVKDITGFSPKEFQNVDLTRWGKFIHPEDREQAFALLDEAQEKGGTYYAEYRFQKKDGSYIFVLDRGIFLVDQRGKSYRMLGTMTDMTATARALADLQKFQLAVEDVDEQIVITDPDAVVLYANKAATEITGYSNAEIIGQRPSLWGKLMPKEFYRQMWKTIKEDKKPWKGELTNRRKNGEKYVADLRISPILGQKGEIKFFVGIERDITERKQSEKAKTEFVSLASHQLRTPLTTINWYVELLLAEDAGKLNKDQQEYLREVYTGSKRMVSLVNDLLNVSRLETGALKIEPKPTKVSNFIRDILKETALLAKERNCKLSLKTSPSIPMVSIDRGLIRQVIYNLLTNALRYSSPKRDSFVEVSVGKTKSGRQEFISVSVADNGIGIPAREQGRVFEKFFRGSNVIEIEAESQGTGLGLYISRLILESVGGRISFKSQIDKGTVFTVLVPAKGMKKKEGRVNLVGQKNEKRK